MSLSQAGKTIRNWGIGGATIGGVLGGLRNRDVEGRKLTGGERVSNTVGGALTGGLYGVGAGYLSHSLRRAPGAISSRTAKLRTKARDLEREILKEHVKSRGLDASRIPWKLPPGGEKNAMWVGFFNELSEIHRR